MISTVYTVPVCDLMLLDGAQDYRVRRQELLAAQPMLDCGTLIEHGDACQPELCLSYNATDCLSEHGKCQPLDAASFEEVARIKMPIGLPYGFHGTFIPAK